LLANGELIEEKGGRDGEVWFRMKKKGSLLKRAYRYPMDWLEEITTRHADRILANSRFTSRVFKTYFPSIMQDPTVVYPGINIQAYTSGINPSDPDIVAIASDRPTLLSLNRFERKKNAELAVTRLRNFIRGSKNIVKACAWYWPCLNPIWLNLLPPLPQQRLLPMQTLYSC
ncbi:hypothetical protein MPER_07727, partial [Moniliophthora perniciosa FA553]